MKRIFIAVLVLGVFFLAMGCSQAKPETKKVVIGVSMNQMDEFRTNWLKMFKDKAVAAGYEVISTDAAGQVSKQISDVESLVTQAPSVILMTPVDPQGAVPAAEAVSKAKIPLLVIDITVDTDKFDVHLATEQGTNGRLLGEYLNSWLKDHPGKTLNAGYIVGAYIPIVMPRMEEIFKTAPAVKKVAEAEGGWSADKGMKITEDWLQSHPEINVICAMNDEMAIGAIQALKAAKRSDVLVFGVDGTQNGQAYVKSGELTATTWMDLDVVVSKAVEIAGGLAEGKKYDKEVAPDAIKLLTKENIASVVK